MTIKIFSKNTGKLVKQVPPGPAPFIDKISVKVVPFNATDATAMFHAFQNAKDKEDLLAKDTKAYRYGYTARRIKVMLDPKRWPVLHFKRHPVDDLAQIIRLEFNPRKLGSKGMHSLKIALIELACDWDYILAYGKITRLDVGVDVPGMNLGDFLFLPPHPTQIMRFNVNGTVETIVHGGKTVDQTLVYSPPEKRKSKGQPYSGPPTIRFERRWRKPPIKKIPELGKLENPFAEFALTFNPPPPPSSKSGWMWETFLDSVKVRGLGPALQMLPAARRARYRKHIKAHPHPQWQPEAVWLQWPKALIKSKVTTPLDASL